MELASPESGLQLGCFAQFRARKRKILSHLFVVRVFSSQCLEMPQPIVEASHLEQARRQVEPGLISTARSKLAVASAVLASILPVETAAATFHTPPTARLRLL